MKLAHEHMGEDLWTWHILRDSGPNRSKPHSNGLLGSHYHTKPKTSYLVSQKKHSTRRLDQNKILSQMRNKEIKFTLNFVKSSQNSKAHSLLLYTLPTIYLSKNMSFSLLSSALSLSLFANWKKQRANKLTMSLWICTRWITDEVYIIKKLNMTI